MNRSQLRFLMRTPWSTLTVLLGLSLGVASVVAVHKISQSVSSSLAGVSPPHLSGFTHLLQKDDLTSSDYFTLRASWRSGGLAGVENMLPIVEGAVAINGRRIRVFATDWFAQAQITQQLPSDQWEDRSVERTAQTDAGPVVVDESLGFSTGDSIIVDGHRYSVVAVVSGGMGAAIFADMGTAQTLLALDPEHLSYVGISVTEPFSDFLELIEAVLPGFSAGFVWKRENWVPAGWQVRTVDVEMPSVGFARSVLFNLGALGSLAVLVAWFLIYQVAVIWLRRRRLMMDRLQMLGVRVEELRRGFLVTIAVLGTLATIIGLLTGTVLAHLLSRISTAEIGMQGVDLALDHWVLIKAALSGIGVCLLAGLVAFQREWSKSDRRPLPVGLIGFGLVVIGVIGTVYSDTGLLGGFTAILVVCLIVVSLVHPLLIRFRRMAGSLPGSLLTRLGFRELSWYPADLSIATGALALAIATSIGVGLMVESFRSDFSLMLNQRLAHDLFATSEGKDLKTVARWLETREDVDGVQLYGSTLVRVDGRPVNLGYTDFTVEEAARYGFPRGLDELEAMVSERFSVDFGVGAGDRVELENISFAVVHVFSGFGDIRPRLLVNTSSLDDSVNLGDGQATFDRLSIDATDVGLLSVDLIHRFPALELQPRAGMRQLALSIFDRTFAITGGLTIVALVVAVIGLYNALLALRLNGQNTVLLLTALGVEPGELRRLALLRAFCVGLLAILLAIPLGITMAWLLCNVINPRAFGWSLNLHVSPAEVIVPLVWGLVAALFAGWLPVPREALNDET